MQAATRSNKHKCGRGMDQNPILSLNLFHFKMTASNEAACRDFPLLRLKRGM